MGPFSARPVLSKGGKSRSQCRLWNYFECLEVARSRKGIAHYRLGDYDDAYDDFEKALLLLDNATTSHYKRIEMYMQHIRRMRKEEKTRLRRTFQKLKLSELYADKDDWAPPVVMPDIDDSDAAIAKILEKYLR